ncbi:MAG: hypothetical protein HYY67_06800 [Thaumarchaeota archaeon]|nr:hypothetical protein [Nitrososphaerota archaeon]
MIKLPKEVVKLSSEATDTVLGSVDRKEDIRKTLTLLPAISTKLEIATELNETPESRFLHFLVWALIESVRYSYQSDKEEWYELNSEAISAARPILRNYLMSIKKFLQKQDMNEFIQASMIFLFKIHKNANMLTKKER